MNKKIINLGILLLFIISCSVSTSNNNFEVKPTTSVSSITSVLPTVTPSVQITPISIPSPTITPTPTAIPTSLLYDFSKIDWIDTYTINKGSLKFDNGYDGKVLIIIDTYLLKEYIKSEEELNRMKRKVMILKDSYNELSKDEKEQLKKEYGEYSIFDPSTYKPIKEGNMERNSTYEGELSQGTIGFQFNTSNSIPIYRGVYCTEKNGYDMIPFDTFSFSNPFSNNLKEIYKNIKISNKKKLMKAPIQKMVFCSISSLSYYSELMYYTVNYFNNIENTFLYEYSIPLSKKSRIWRIFIS